MPCDYKGFVEVWQDPYPLWIIWYVQISFLRKIGIQIYFCYKLSMHNKHSIFAFVGASGSGKSTIMIELLSHFPHLEIIKSTTTRPKRDDSDEIFYKFVDESYLTSPDGLLTHEIFDGHHYIYEQKELDSVLQARCGMFAVIEPTIPKLMEHGYNLKLINIVPSRDFELTRSILRKQEDSIRAQEVNLPFDLVVENSFALGGLEKSVQQVAEFIHNTIAPHTQID